EETKAKRSAEPEFEFDPERILARVQGRKGWLRDAERQLEQHRCEHPGTRPRDLRSSFVTLRVYEGVPLTQIAKEVGTSVRMIEQHYAGVVENWDGERVPADAQIRAARSAMDPQRTLWPTGRET
ncbi:MAG: hypothetical protein ACXVHB_28695, partial [Solirubrobacteraceae bacterium]